VEFRHAIANRNFCCGDCGFTSDDAAEVRNHQREAHPTPKNFKGLICTHCGECVHFADYESQEAARAAMIEHGKHCEKSPHLAKIRELEAQIENERAGWQEACDGDAIENEKANAELEELRRQVVVLKAARAWSCAYCHTPFDSVESAAEHEKVCEKSPYMKELAGVQALLDVAHTEIDGWKKKDKIDREWEAKLRVILGIPNKRVSILKVAEKLVHIRAISGAEIQAALKSVKEGK
jgi:hypothetical protein